MMEDHQQQEDQDDGNSSDIVEMFTEEDLAALRKLRSTREVTASKENAEVYKLLEVINAIQQESKQIESKILETR